MGDLKTSVVVDLAGNLERNAKKYGTSLGNFSKKGQQHLSRLGKTARFTGRMLDRAGNRYTALLSGAAGVGSAKMVIGLERRFTRLGIQANKSADEMNVLKKEIYDAANAPDIRVDPGQITSAIEAIVEKTGDLEFAKANINNIGAAIQATGADGGAIGEIMAEFQKMGIVLKKDVLQAMDILNVQGKEGAFTLENLAALGPRVVTAYTSMGRTGVGAIREMGAALQIIRMGTGSSEQAATAFEAVMRTLSDKEKIKKLQAGGIQVFDLKELKKGNEVLRPINELMVEIVKKTKGKKTILSTVFDAEAVRAFNAAGAEFKRTNAVASMDKFMNVHADGTTTLNDSARAAKDAAGSMEMLTTAWKKFADESLTGPIQDLADLLNTLGSETTGKIIQGLVYGGAGALLAGKVYKAVKGGKDDKGGLAGAAGGLASGVTPVYVVNMSGGSMPGMGGGKSTRNVAKFSKLKTSAALLGGSNLSNLKMMGAGALGTAGLAVTAAGAAGYGAGSLINKYLVDDTALGEAIGRGMANVMAVLGNQKAKIALEIDSKGNASVKSMKSDTMELSVDSGMVMP